MKKAKYLQMLRSYTKIVLIGVTLITSCIDSSAQKSYLSFLIARDITGSGLGGNVCPSIALTHNKNTLSIGPNFQRRNFNFSGVQANYRYSVATNYSGKIELYFSGNLTVHTSAQMSHTNIEIEKSSHSEETFNYEDLRFKVIECYGGIGLKVNPTKKLSTGFSAGFGMFDTLNKNYNREMYREKAAVALQLRFILIYNFKKW